MGGGTVGSIVLGLVRLALAAILDVGFYIVLAGVAAREVLASRNRNAPIVGLVLLLGVANAVDYLGAAGLLLDADIGIRAAISLVVVMISLIGGRLVPSFTRNWMLKQGIERRLPTQPTRFDLAVVTATAATLLAWIAAPDWRPAGWLIAATGCAQALRLSRWGGLRSVRAPIVFILHVGYLWVPVGLLLLGASVLGMSIPRAAAIHALTAGAMATMILAVMSRATLGHTGRELVAGPPTALVYGLITVGAVWRVAAPLGFVDYAVGIDVAAAAWAGAFVLFLAIYGPILFSPGLREH